MRNHSVVDSKGAFAAAAPSGPAGSIQTAAIAPEPARVLETRRLLLRHLTAADAVFILELLNEPAFIRHIADRNVRTLEEAATYIREKLAASYEEHGFGLYAVVLKETGAALGICGLLKRESLADVDIGFAFLEQFWGRGYAFESASAVMDYARNQLGLPRIVAITSPGNRASIQLVEKLGLHFQRMIQLPGHAAESNLFG